jgi:hypothetical protein
MHRSAAAAFAFGLLLAGCGGGGGTSGLPTLTAPASGGSAVAPPSTAGNVTGQVLDLSSYSPGGSAPGWSVSAAGTPVQGNAPVKGAVVMIGPVLITGATAPQRGANSDASAVTDARGNFSLNAPAGTQYLSTRPRSIAS